MHSEKRKPVWKERISREDMYKEILLTIQKRSTCPIKQVGALLVKDKRIIAMGYNGVLPGSNPLEGYDKETGETNTVHAEANIIAFCAKNGIPTEGCELYITLSPCKKCAELIIQSGITRVLYIEGYRDLSSLATLEKHSVYTYVL